MQAASLNTLAIEWPLPESCGGFESRFKQKVVCEADMFEAQSVAVQRTAGASAARLGFCNDGPKMNLRASIVIAVIVGLLLPVSLSTAFTILRQEKILAEQFTADHRGLADLLSVGMRTPLWNLSVDEGRPLFDSVLNDERVVSVLVSDNKAGPFLFREYPERRVKTQVTEQRAILTKGKRSARCSSKWIPAGTKWRSRIIATYFC